MAVTSNMLRRALRRGLATATFSKVGAPAAVISLVSTLKCVLVSCLSSEYFSEVD